MHSCTCFSCALSSFFPPPFLCSLSGVSSHVSCLSLLSSLVSSSVAFQPTPWTLTTRARA
jgi:hypothetical protein